MLVQDGTLLSCACRELAELSAQGKMFSVHLNGGRDIANNTRSCVVGKDGWVDCYVLDHEDNIIIEGDELKAEILYGNVTVAVVDRPRTR